MKTLHISKFNNETAATDTIIGRALSRSLSKSPPDLQCPTAERMAAFVDGGVAEEERDNILKHLAACDRCREVCILAHNLIHPVPVRQGRRRWYIAGTALAAAASMILAVKLTVQQPALSGQKVVQVPAIQREVASVPLEVATHIAPKPSAVQPALPQIPPFAVGEAARELARVATADTLAIAIGAPRSRSYGFAGNSSRQGTAFMAGKELFELELWLAAEDRERARLAGERLLPLLRSLGGDAATVPLDDLFPQLENNEPVARKEDIASKLETLLKMTDVGFIRLGGWAASAWVASRVGKDAYFAGNAPQRFLKDLGTDLSPEAQTVLKRLGENKKGNSSELQRLLGELSTSI